MAITDASALKGLRDSLQSIVDTLAAEGGAAGTPRVELERPRDEAHGDYATNAALMLAPVLRQPPREVAQQIAERAGALPGVASVEVAGPGFLNVRMDDAWYLDTLAAAHAEGAAYGSRVLVDAPPILLEFVSANPTGPIVAASARHAAFGDSLARLLRHAGHVVSTEYYVNDAGRQTDLFGESIRARAAGEEIPEGGYEGDYVVELAAELGASADDDPVALGARGVAAMLELMRASMERMHTSFDRFQSERALHDAGSVAAGVDRLIELGVTLEEDGAVLLRTTAYGDDRDRAVRRANGVPTYFAADVAYLLDKFSRIGDDGHLIYVLGADHHGYIARLKAAAQALGFAPERVEILIMQMVTLVEDGEQKKMSKRRGDFVTADELVDRIGPDATRFFMLQRSNDQQLDLDLDVAEAQNDSNPVFYVQYAHARLCSIMRKVAEAGISMTDAQASVAAPDVPLEPSEKRLIKRIGAFPMLVAEAAERRQPHKLVHYAHDLASDVAKFYRDCRVVGEDVPEALTKRRLVVCDTARSVLALALDLVGVTAPERM